MSLYCRLSVCEKALAEYLETKRLTFPRFYFVSASDLLEIVSKGTQPRQVAAILTHYKVKKWKAKSPLCVYLQKNLCCNAFVCKCVYNAQVTRHLLKLFDNLADLRFKQDDDGATDPKTTVALGMYSREGEYVPFSQPCVCEGQVRHNDTYTTVHL